MFATLNLQLTSTESFDTSLADTAVTLDGGSDVAAGFADLLRLRVDATLAEPPAGGELLPHGGSGLPVELNTDASTADAQAAPGIDLQVPVAYPALQTEAEPAQTRDAAIERLPELAPAVAVPGAQFGIMTTLRDTAHTASVLTAGADAIDTGQQKPLPPVAPAASRQAIAAQLLQAANTTPEGPELMAAESAMLSRGPAPAQHAAVLARAASRDDALPLPELQRRSEGTALQAAVSGAKDLSDVFKPRPTVIQPVQVLNTHINPQQGQPSFNVASTVSTPSEVSYAAAQQQAGELISTPVRDAAWGEQIGQRVLLMAGNQLKTAEIRLTPAELGPMRVHVSVDDGAANVTFQAQHAVTREAIEQALPRLRELLSENGLSLGQANVGEHGTSESNRDREQSAVQDQSVEELVDGGEEAEPSSVTATVTNGLVDTFA